LKNLFRPEILYVRGSVKMEDFLLRPNVNMEDCINAAYTGLIYLCADPAQAAQGTQPFYIIVYNYSVLYKNFLLRIACAARAVNVFDICFIF